MLTNLSLENFKSWKRIANMRFAPITGLFGSNSSGKTSILQLLLMLKQTLAASNRPEVLFLGDQNSQVALGSLQDVIHNHVQPAHLQWKVSWRLPEPLRIPDPSGDPLVVLFEGETLAFECAVCTGNPGSLYVEKLAYDFADHEFKYVRKGPNAYKLSATGPSEFELTRTQGQTWDLPAPVKCYAFPDQVKAYYQNAGFLSVLALANANLFERVHYLGPSREYPKRQYTWVGIAPLDVGQRGEKVVDALLAAQHRGERISRGKRKPKLALERYVAQWLKELELIHDIQVKRVSQQTYLYEVFVQKAADSATVLLTDVGFGVSQILPVIVLCYYVPAGSTIILEQPESHLHPGGCKPPWQTC